MMRRVRKCEGKSNNEKRSKSIINGIIKQKYNKDNNSLNLYQLKDHWADAIKKHSWKGLKKLYVMECGINDSNISVLSQGQWTFLQEFWLTQNQIKSLGMSKLLQNSFDKLTTLSLSYNSINQGGARILAKLYAPLLESVYLVSNSIGRAGAKNLTKANWPNLENIWIESNNIQLDGHLDIPLNNWSRLQILSSSDEKADPNYLRRKKSEINPIFVLPFVTLMARCSMVSIDYISNQNMRRWIRKIIKLKTNTQYGGFEC